MKVLFITENAYCGGLDSFIVTLIDHWPYAGDELTLVCNESHPGLALIRKQLRRQCRVIGHDYPLPWSISERRQPLPLRLLLFPFRLAWRQWLFVRYLSLFRRLFAETGAERLMVINGGYPAGLTCRAATVAWGLAGRRSLSIHNFHNFGQPARWFERPFECAIDHLVHRYASAMVSVSRICMASLSVRPAFSNSPKLGYVHNGIAFRPARAAPAVVRAGLGIAAEAPLCLMLGTYEPRKGHEFLLQAFRAVAAAEPTARLVICGFGYPAEIERVRAAVAAQGLGEHVVLEGFREDVPDLLAASTLLLVPSQSSESFGLTIVEAMSHGVPVIATRIGGIPEVLEDGEGGYLVAPDDVEEFALRMLALIGDATLRRELGEKGRARFERLFRAERMATDYAALIRQSETVSADPVPAGTAQ